MTNEEAIETLENLKNLLVNKTNIEAIDFSIAALREKADKDRRYVVHSYETMGKVYWCVYDKYQHRSAASEIATEQAAQAIADIYEGLKP